MCTVMGMCVVQGAVLCLVLDVCTVLYNTVLHCVLYFCECTIRFCCMTVKQALVEA